MLGAGGDVFLDAARISSAEFPEYIRVFAVAFLCASPARMADRVDLGGEHQVEVQRCHFTTHGLPNAVFKIGVKASASR